ncbi:2'-5' RNA ligase family protein [Streptomyces sp. NPDC016469]|uniref:2'-5' RNA ligase family protein n=1 Tax=Streptomyces sp. NPDC016469 TaxID=3157191 RepID=UPI0033DBC5C1
MTRRLGIALLPCPDHTRAAVRLQQDLGAAGEPLRPVLSEDGNLPHLTVFQGWLDDGLEPGPLLERIAASLSLPAAISLASAGLVHQPTGWLFMSVERPALLGKLQETVIGLVGPHLDRSAFDTAQDMSHFTDAERASYARYGYRYTGEAYTPHLTLGRTDERTALALARTGPGRTAVPGTWTFDRLSCYVMGEHGAHAETLAARPLG